MVAPVILILLTLHWKRGVDPPFTGEAVNVTEVPAQTELAEGVAVTLTVRSGFTFIVTVFEEAGLPLGQVALDESKQITASL